MQFIFSITNLSPNILDDETGSLKTRNSCNIASCINFLIYSSLNSRNSQFLISKFRRYAYLVKTSVGGKKQKLRKTFHSYCFSITMYSVINYDNAISMVSWEGRHLWFFEHSIKTCHRNECLCDIYQKVREKHTIWKLHICLFIPMSDCILR